MSPKPFLRCPKWQPSFVGMRYLGVHSHLPASGNERLLADRRKLSMSGRRAFFNGAVKMLLPGFPPTLSQTKRA